MGTGDSLVMKTGFSQTIRTWDQGQIRERVDLLAEEAPLEILIDHCDGQHWHRQNIAVTMRTPSDDRALALGFLLTETVIASMQDVEKTEERLETSPQRVIVRLKDHVRVDMQKL